MSQIFLSYAHEDAESAREIYQLLIDNQLLVWMDENDLVPGQDWKLAIEAAINQCDIFIACLSKNSVTKKGYFQKELRTACEVLETYPEEKVFIIPIRFDDCPIPSRVKHIHCLDFHGSNSKEKLIKAILAPSKTSDVAPKIIKQVENSNPAPELINSPEKNEQFFDVGERVKIVRQEINAKSSEFFEALGLQSEREYLEMEGQGKEVPLSVLKKIHILTGVSLGWLKDGQEPRYKVDVEYFYPIKKGLDFIAKLKPKDVFFTFGLPNRGFEKFLPENMSTGIVVQTGEYRYQVIDYGMSLDFWTWVDHRGLIPLYYDFLSILGEQSLQHNGVGILGSLHKQLTDGKIHFITALKRASHKYVFWPDAVLDINYREHPKAFYEKWYGSWIIKTHDSYKKVVAEIALDHEFDGALISLCENLKGKGFEPIYILDEFKDNRGVFAVKRIFYRNEGLEQLKKLQELNLLDQSMEALVIQRNFQPLFTKDEVAKARERLKEVGFFKQQR